MTLVNAETGEIVERPTYDEVKQSVEQAKSSLEAAAEQIVWQIERRAWEVLGYSSWNEMREAEYGGAAFMVPRAERPELVARMRRSGLTQQDIADTAGVNIATVNRDLANARSADAAAEPQAVTNARGQQRPATYRRPEPPHPAPAEQAADAVAEFPDLAHYVEVGRSADAVQMAEDLRRYRERGELDDRLSTLRRSIEIDKAKRAGTYQPTPAPRPVADMSPTPTRHCPTCTCHGSPA